MASNDWKRIILGGAEIAFGIAFISRGLGAVFGQPPQSPLLGGLAARGPRAARPGQQVVDAVYARQTQQLSEGSDFFDPARPRGKIQARASVHTVRNIDERVAYIADMMRRSSLYPQTREDAIRILGRKCGARWCTPPKNDVAEIRALFRGITDPSSPHAVRYTGDHVEVDQFQHYRITRQLRAGDCDDTCIALGAMLRSVGFPVRMRVVQTRGEDTYNHIYLLVGLPRVAPTHWMPLDPTVKRQPGWEVPGAAATLSSGRAQGEVIAARDFEV